MSKKRYSNKPPRPAALKAQQPLPKNKGPWQYLKLSYAIWSFIFGIIGPISVVYSFYPTVSVPSSSSLDKDNPFSAPFIINNQSIFAITDVRISLKLKKVNLVYGKARANFNDSFLNMQGAEQIGRHQSITRFLMVDRIIGSDVTAKIAFAQVDLLIRYKYLFLSFEEKRSFRSYQAPDNTVTWLPE